MNLTEPVGEGWYRTVDVAKAAGVSLRQLQWWDEKKLLEPLHDGACRQYSELQLAQAKRLGQLRRAGVSLQEARKILKRGLSWSRVVVVKKPTVLASTEGVLVVPK